MDNVVVKMACRTLQDGQRFNDVFHRFAKIHARTVTPDAPLLMLHTDIQDDVTTKYLTFETRHQALAFILFWRLENRRRSIQ